MATTANSNDKILIHTNSSSIIRIVDEINNWNSSKLQKPNQNIYLPFLLVIYKLTQHKNLQLTTHLGTKIKKQDDNITLTTEFDPRPFLHKYFLPTIYRYPIYILLKLLISDIFKATNISNWTQQNKISQWNTGQNSINWQLTFAALNWDNKPNTRYTSTALSNIKNFKIKLITNELPNRQILYQHNPSLNQSPACLRCNYHQEHNQHWMTCPTNTTTIQALLEESLNNVNQYFKITIENTNTFINNFIQVHINQALPIGLVTAKTTLPSQKHNVTAKLHHELTKKIHKEIWKPSRMVTSQIANTPPQINLTDPSTPKKISNIYIYSNGSNNIF